MTETDIITADHPAYAHLLALSERYGWPTSYPRDLRVHDRSYLAEKQPPVFGWTLYLQGTHLYDPRYKGYRSLEAVLGTGFTPPLHHYWWDGTALYRVSATILMDLLHHHDRTLDYLATRFVPRLRPDGRYYAYDTKRHGSAYYGSENVADVEASCLCALDAVERGDDDPLGLSKAW